MLDYVPELGQAIGSIARVLKRRAVVFIHYSDNRLLDGAQPPGSRRIAAAGRPITTQRVIANRS